LPNQFEIINLTYLESISDGDSDIIKELITIFIDQMPEFYDGFAESYEKSEWLKIAAFAHKAKSSVLSMGIDELGNKDLKNLELICKQMVLNELENKADINAIELSEIEKIKKSFKGYEPERMEWIKNNCNEGEIKELIDKFNLTCNKAVNELNTVLEN